MQNKKKGKERNLGDDLQAIGRAMGKKFTDCITDELGSSDPRPICLTLKYRPGNEYDWFDDPVISISTGGGNTTIFDSLTGNAAYDDEDEDSEDEE